MYVRDTESGRSCLGKYIFFTKFAFPVILTKEPDIADVNSVHGTKQTNKNML